VDRELQHRHPDLLMSDFTKLELSTETIRELTEDELAQVAGGVNDTTILGGETGTFLCPSGRTWTANCQITLA
jgi:bacteriocin-like protein